MSQAAIGQVEAARPAGVPATVEQLQKWLDDRAHRQARSRARRWGRAGPTVPTGLTALDAALPGGGVPAGAVTEVLSDGYGWGALSLALRLVQGCLAEADVAGPSGGERAPPRRGQPPLVVVDGGQDFYPPAAAALGVPIERLLVIRATVPAQMVWALEQVLQSRAVAAVVATVGRLDERASRRLQLAALQGGRVGVLVRSQSSAAKSFAALRLEVCSHGWPGLADQPDVAVSTRVGEPRLCEIRIVKARDRRPVEPFWVDLHHATGALPALARPRHRSASGIG